MCYDYLHLQLKKLMLRHVNILKITQQVRQETEPKSISASPHTVHTYIFLLDVHLGKKKKSGGGGADFSQNSIVDSLRMEAHKDFKFR